MRRLEELKKRLEVLEESIDPVDEIAAKILKSLTNPDRIKILEMFSERPMSFKEIKDVSGVESPTVSHHLKLLKKNWNGVLKCMRAACFCAYLKLLPL